MATEDASEFSDFQSEYRAARRKQGAARLEAAKLDFVHSGPCALRSREDSGCGAPVDVGAGAKVISTADAPNAGHGTIC
jgi:hypothetical protein